MLTPEDYAAALQDANCPHYDLGRGDYREAVDCIPCVAAAIREAVQAETEACAEIARLRAEREYAEADALPSVPEPADDADVYTHAGNVAHAIEAKIRQRAVARAPGETVKPC